MVTNDTLLGSLITGWLDGENERDRMGAVPINAAPSAGTRALI